MPLPSSNASDVIKYYNHTESRLGYALLLGGTKHFGWFEPGDSTIRLRQSMRRMEQKLGDTLGLPSGARLLDAGCGVGDVARYLARNFGYQIDGIDILDFNIAEATERSRRANLTSRTRFQLGDYHHLPFAPSSFDGAYLVETLVHASDSATVLRNIFKVLKPGGRLAMLEYSRAPDAALSSDARAAMEQIYEMGAMPSWRRFLPGVLETEITQAGFTEVTELDITERILPMLRRFYQLGVGPYKLLRRMGRVEKGVNAMSGVETWRHQEAWRYNLYTANKPLAAE